MSLLKFEDRPPKGSRGSDVWAIRTGLRLADEAPVTHDVFSLVDALERGYLDVTDGVVMIPTKNLVASLLRPSISSGGSES
jgi:hypothetical protein